MRDPVPAASVPRWKTGERPERLGPACLLSLFLHCGCCFTLTLSFPYCGIPSLVMLLSFAAAQATSIPIHNHPVSLACESLRTLASCLSGTLGGAVVADALPCVIQLCTTT